MTPRAYHLDSAVRKDGSPYTHGEFFPAAQYDAEVEKHCAYNHTRERFLGAKVDVADFSIGAPDTRLPVLSPNSGEGLWLVPFKGISLTSVRVPVDLVYLNRDCVVIDTVESFPIFPASDFGAFAASVLVLPADTLRSTETQPGDQLLLCFADEMKHRLQRLANSTNSSADGEREQTAPSSMAGPVRTDAFRLLQWEDHSRPKNPAEMVSAVDPTPVELPKGPASSLPELQERGSLESAAMEPAAIKTSATETKAIEPAQKDFKAARTWLQRLLAIDPPHQRSSPRETLRGLVAYFFTGGAPEAHDVRDISQSGVYVLTKERWYPGTVVRMTLTDCFEPTVERSITVNMAVVRWGNDGVGLKFLLQGRKDRGRGQAGGVNTGHVDQFLHRLRHATV
jgi:hypothetical protein